MHRGLDHLSYEEKWGVGVVQPGEEKTLWGLYSCIPAHSGGLENNLRWDPLTVNVVAGQEVMDLKQSWSRLDIRNKFSTVRVGRHWHRLLREAECPIFHNVQGQAGWGFWQTGLVGSSPDHSTVL